MQSNLLCGDFHQALIPRIHFGVGNITVVDSLKIKWPDDKIQLIRNIKANQLLVVKYQGCKIGCSG